MLAWLTFFLALPVVELMLLLRIGARIGTGATLLLIVVTGVVGASLARAQGLEVLRRLRAELDAGRVPQQPALDGVAILVAAALLVTPGVLTDAVGFALLTPAFRAALKRYLLRRWQAAVREGRVHVHVHDAGPPREEKVVHDLRDVRDVTPRDRDDAP